MILKKFHTHIQFIVVALINQSYKRDSTLSFLESFFPGRQFS